MNHIFALRMTAEKYLAKGRKLYVAFMDLEKAYDKFIGMPCGLYLKFMWWEGKCENEQGGE